MPFLIGSLTPDEYAASAPTHISHLRQAQELKNGDVVEFFGHALIYDTEGFGSEETCMKWRRIADPICDNALREALNLSFTSTGKDLFGSVQRCARERPDAIHAAAFMREVSQHPPSDIIVTASDLKIAQDFYFDYFPQIHIALLYFAVAGGFGSPRILRTLESISYLGKPKKDGALADEAGKRISSRLVETVQFFLDIMGCTQRTHGSSDPEEKLDDLLPGGEAWKSTLRIRLLHAVLRRRVAGQYSRKPQPYPGTGPDDVPISEEDMATTLAAFSVVPIWMIKRIGLKIRPEQEKAFISVWRHIGFYIGVRPQILRKYFLDPSVSNTFLASMLLNAFQDVIPLPLTAEKNKSVALIAAATSSTRPWTPLAFHIAIARSLLGDALSDHRGLPKTSPIMRIAVNTAFYVFTIPVRFGYWYARDGWLVSYRSTIRAALINAVRWGMGKRHVTFYPHEPMQGDDKVPGEKNKGLRQTEDVALEPVAWRYFILRISFLIIEMMLVFSAAFAIPAILTRAYLRTT